MGWQKGRADLPLPCMVVILLRTCPIVQGDLPWHVPVLQPKKKKKVKFLIPNIILKKKKILNCKDWKMKSFNAIFEVEVDQWLQIS